MTETAFTNQDLTRMLERIPYAQTLGVKPLLIGTDFILVLPFTQNNIGNPLLPALHGGAIGGFLELAAIAQLVLNEPGRPLPKPIGVSVDYLKRGHPAETYARASITKHGSRVANVQVRAWQNNDEDPIAILHGHFMLARADG